MLNSIHMVTRNPYTKRFRITAIAIGVTDGPPRMFGCSTNVHRLMNKFVIVTTPRSGSNMLVGMLNRHPQIKCLGE